MADNLPKCTCPPGFVRETTGHMWGCPALVKQAAEILEKRATEIPWLPITTACDLSETSVRDAALKMRPSFLYTLHVCYSARFDAYELARRVQVPEHPFAAYINVELDADRFKRSASARPWWLDNNNGEAVGSEGA